MVRPTNKKTLVTYLQEAVSEVEKLINVIVFQNNLTQVG